MSGPQDEQRKPTIEDKPKNPHDHPYDQKTLRDTLDAKDMDEKDFRMTEKISLSGVQRAQLRQIKKSYPFEPWLNSPTNAVLFMHWQENTAALSYCAHNLTQELRNDGLIENCISAVWFSRFHTIPAKRADIVSPSTIVGSLVDQLLREKQILFGDKLPGGIQEYRLRKDSSQQYDARCKLLQCLVQKLPEEMTVVFIIDQVMRYWGTSSAGALFDTLLRMAHSKDKGRARMKVLFTNATHYDAARNMFEEEEVLDVDKFIKEHPIPSDIATEAKERGRGRERELEGRHDWEREVGHERRSEMEGEEASELELGCSGFLI